MAPTKYRTLQQVNKRKSTRKQHLAKMNAARLACRTKDLVPTHENGTSSQIPAVTTSTPPASEPDTVPVQPSASRRKLSYFSSSAAPSEPSSPRLPTTITDLNSLSPLFEGLNCKTCGLPGLSLIQGRGSRAYAVHLQAYCTNCCSVNTEAFTSPKSSTQAYDMNRRCVATGLTSGIGYSGLCRLSEGLGMPVMHVKTYQSHLNSIFIHTKDLAADFLQQSRQKVFDYYREKDPEAFGEDGILDIAVSFDGTWPKRGHTSKLGCGMVVEVMTGLIIDFHVMSLHCQLCSTTGHKLKTRSTTIHEQWLRDHQAKGLCTQNYAGSSGGMEVEAALTVWKRSTRYLMRYTTLVGDGDTKTFLSLTKEKPYGEIPIRKEECVNHVAKRLNSGLRSLKTSLSKQSIRIGGNTKGSLTDAKIGLLQSYYTKAVRTYNQSVESMAKAIWGAFYHSISTDEKPQHDHCPTGTDSWCWFQQDLAAGVTHPCHGDKPQSTFLNEKVAEHVKAVYTRLTAPDPLSRCLLGKTQNANESVHSVIWSRCPKHLWNGYKRVFIATVLGIGEFKMGSVATSQFLCAVGCLVAVTSRDIGCKRDKKRIIKADAAQAATSKRQRESRRLAQQKQIEAVEAAEGGPSYISGGF